MDQNTIHIDSLLQRSFGDFAPMPPIGAWDAIAAQLPGETRRRGFAWWTAAAVLLLIIGGVCYFNRSQRAEVSNEEASSKAAPAQSADPRKGTLNTEDKGAAANSENTGAADEQSKELSPSYYKAHAQNGSEKGNNPNPQGSVQNPIKNNIERIDEIIAAEVVVKETEVLKPFEVTSFSGLKGTGLRETTPAMDWIATAPIPVMLPHKTVAIGRNWFLGVAVGQGFNNPGMGINPKYSAYVHKDYLNELNKGQSSISALNFSMQLGVGIYKNLNVYTGISYMERGSRSDFNFQALTHETNNTAAPDKFNEYPIDDYFPGFLFPVKFNSMNRVTVIDIPVGVSYNYRMGRNWNVTPSLSYNFGFLSDLSGRTINYNSMKATDIRKEWYRKNFNSLNMGLGVQRTIGRRLSLGAGINTNYTLTPMYVPGATVRPSAWVSSLSTQLTWRLTK